MGSFAPIRDTTGGIVGMQETQFAQTLHETMAAVGATEPEAQKDTAPRPAWRPGRLELAGVVCGLVLAAALIAALNTFWPAPAPRLSAPTAAPAPTAMPTIAPTPALQDAYAAPGGALLGTIPLTATLAYQHSGYPGWGGVAWQGAIVWVMTDAPLAQLEDLAPPPTAAPRPPSAPAPPIETPVAAPAEPCTLANAPFVATREVIMNGVPLEQVRAASCESQAEAEAKADALHDRVLAEATAAAAEVTLASPAGPGQATPSAR